MSLGWVANRVVTRSMVRRVPVMTVLGLELKRRGRERRPQDTLYGALSNSSTVQ
jgi:hypothetical protein